MPPDCLALAQASGLFERLIFGGPPEWWQRLLLGLGVIALAFAPLVSLIGLISIWGERKIAGHIQSRYGPNRVGPFGLFQSVADGLKLLLKEDLIPRDADRPLFRLAPYLAFAPVFAALVVLPFGPDLAFEPAVNVGVFYVLAVLGVEVIGVIVAGWASNNKWAVYGAMREACQMVSYEIPLGIAIIIAVMTAGTLNMVELGHLQGGGLHTWLVFRDPFILLAFFTYFVASLASNKRAPFDLPESESELVAGYHTEYSGIRFSFFFFAEYLAMFVVGAIQASLFLGGWHDPFGLMGHYYQIFSQQQNTAGLILINIVGAAIFTAKASLIMIVQMWLRWTLPRPRIDQVLYTCMKVLLPLSFALLLGAALWQLFLPTRTDIPWRDFNPLSWSGWTQAPRGASPVALVVHLLLASAGSAAFVVLAASIIRAAAVGARHRRRLAEPLPIEVKP